ncbi:PREDICTED: F-box protein At3g58530-like isoform X2 [Camelina sativa]|nr:PREDICTED: F-box protein At3g58530-like isoform X2 [Camelina sativa]
MANSWTSLEFLSLFGIVGVTDRCLETLSQTCSATLTTLDANGCIGIKSKLGGGSQQQGQRVSYNKSKLTLGLRTVKIDKGFGNTNVAVEHVM